MIRKIKTKSKTKYELERTVETIGKTRGGIAWIVAMATMELVATKKYPNGDMLFEPERTELLRAKGLATMGQEPKGAPHRVELVQSVNARPKENPEQGGGMYVIRPG